MTTSQRCTLGTARKAIVPVSVAIALGLAVAGSGCGSSDDSGASELAKQREIAAAERQAARIARQGERIKQLERRVKNQPPPQPIGNTTPQSYDWPGGSGYTAMLGAFKVESDARSRQHEATLRGIDAGVMWSSDYSSLNPGYWAVFSGTFQTSSEARDRANRAKELGYTDSYPRFVSP